MKKDTTTLSAEILCKVAKNEWIRMGQTDKRPEVTTNKLREWLQLLPTDELFELMAIANDELWIDSKVLIKKMPREPEPDSSIAKMWYRIRRCRIQHAIDVPIQTRDIIKNEDFSRYFGLENGTFKADIEDQEIINPEEIKPRMVVSMAVIAVISGWKNEKGFTTIKERYGIGSFEDGVVAIHNLWSTVNEKHQDEFLYPIEPIVNQYLHEMCIKKVSREYDRTHPAAVLKSPLGSVQEINFNGQETARLREFATPESVEPVQTQLFETQSLLPNVLPLDVAHPLGVEPTTKAGAVPHVLRIFFEALMALEPSQTKMDISFTLGDLIHYLYPDGKFHRTNQLPHIINALEILHTYATVPFRQENGDMGRWRPVVVRNVISKESKNDTRILLDVRLPPDAQQGMLVQKDILRILGKKSAPQFCAYLSACYLWDKYGTQGGKLIDPSRPIESRNTEGYLVDANGNELRGHDGNRIKNLYSPDAIPQLEREPNPSRINYPILSYEDLIKACNLNEAPNKHMALKRAKDYWERLEENGVVAIERLSQGWRIMPSKQHMKTYRAMIQAIQNSRE